MLLLDTLATRLYSTTSTKTGLAQQLSDWNPSRIVWPLETESFVVDAGLIIHQTGMPISLLNRCGNRAIT